MEKCVNNTKCVVFEINFGSPKQDVNVVEHVYEVIKCKPRHVGFEVGITSKRNGKRTRFICYGEW
jgi:hypothetical protein